jgi:DNA replication and repair protein RecF
MWLRTLRADRLRNLRAVDVGLPAGLTLLTGRNGQGKTSLLEAAYLLGTGFSFRTRRFEDLVSWDGGPTRVSGAVERRGRTEKIAVVVDDAVRRLVVEGAEVDLERFLGRLDVVVMAGEGQRVLRDAPEQRRRFLDSGIVAQRPSFLRVLGEFRRVLAERNALLRSDARGDGARRNEHEAWEERLAAAAAAVHQERRSFAVSLASKIGEVERAVFPDEGNVVLRFLPSPAETGREAPARFTEAYRRLLEQTRPRDRLLGYTCVGPHRDDFRVDLGRADLRRFGSAGQVRAAMVALCLAKLGLLTERRGESPLFLMDDFDSDLDEARAAALVAYLHEGRFQAVLATAKEGWAARLGVPFLRIRVEGGEAASR